MTTNKINDKILESSSGCEVKEKKLEKTIKVLTGDDDFDGSRSHLEGWVVGANLEGTCTSHSHHCQALSCRRRQ